MENYSFDSYDPNAFNEYVAMGDSYDDAAGTAPSMRAPRQGFRALGGVGQVDILLTNTISSASTVDPGGITRFDIFNYNRSGGLIGNTQYSARVVSGLSFEEYALTNPGTFPAVTGGPSVAQIAAAKENKYMWDNTGSLYLTGKSTGTGTNTEQLVISCRQLPYRTLLNSSQTAPFLVSKMRLTVPDTTNGKLQINQDFTHVTNTFLGATKENPISPRAFFNPNQFQTNIVDIKAAFAIDGEKGLKYQVTNVTSGTEVHTVTLFIPAFEKPTNAKTFR